MKVNEILEAIAVPVTGGKAKPRITLRWDAEVPARAGVVFADMVVEDALAGNVYYRYRVSRQRPHSTLWVPRRSGELFMGNKVYASKAEAMAACEEDAQAPKSMLNEGALHASAYATENA